MKLVVRENRIKTPAICTLICGRSRRLTLAAYSDVSFPNEYFSRDAAYFVVAESKIEAVLKACASRLYNLVCHCVSVPTESYRNASFASVLSCITDRR